MQHSLAYGRSLSRAGLLSFAVLAFYALSASLGYAQVGTVICGVWDIIYSDVGRGVATLAICALGVGALFGKVSWGLAVTVAVGLAVMFNADYLANILVGDSC